MGYIGVDTKMAEEAFYFDDFATLDLSTDGGVTSTPVAGIQGITIIPSVTIDELFTGDSAKVDTKKQREFTVDVGIEYAKWDDTATVVQQWLGGDGASASSWTDTNSPQQFEITAEFDSVSGDTTLSCTVDGITFEQLPIVDSSMGEYMSRDLSGSGSDITDLSTTDNTV